MLLDPLLYKIFLEFVSAPLEQTEIIVDQLKQQHRDLLRKSKEDFDTVFEDLSEESDEL